MAGRLHYFQQCWSVLRASAVMLLGVLAIGAPGSALQAQTIENIAYASWNDGDVVRETSSNQVTLTLEEQRTAITTFRIVQDSAQSLTYIPSACGSTPAARARTVNVEPVSAYRIGETMLVAVDAAFANRDPGMVETVTLVVTSPSGDRETLTLVESGSDTGYFIGSLVTVRAVGTVAGEDCRLSVENGDVITIAPAGLLGESITLRRDVAVLADPFSIVFDSETGEPVSGARVTLRDIDTGLPAQVFAEDGTTPWPSTVISGAPVTDLAGNTYPMAPGRYWFPLTMPGRYRLEVAPPPPFTAPSSASRQQLGELARPDGRGFVITDASFGAEFALPHTAPLEIDIPLDAPGAAIALAQTVSRPVVEPGDTLLYAILANNPNTVRERRDLRITVTVPRGMRLRPDTILIDGRAAPDKVQLSEDGLTFVITLDTLAAGGVSRIAYAATVRADTRAGQLESTAEAVDGRGHRARANSVVRVERNTISGRMTIIGRVVLGDCRAPGAGTGLAGIRMVMEDGSFAVTDAEGRYRFEGVVPGTHVVQLARTTLPQGGQLADCDSSTRSAGDPASRFVVGQGGSLARADFHVVGPAGPPIPFENARAADDREQRPGAAVSGSNASSPSSEPAAAPAPRSAPPEAEWLALGDGPDGWLAPEEDYNPRAPAVRVVFRHRPGLTVRLLVDGKPVDQTAFDGTAKSPGGRFAVSMWRGVPLLNETTVLTAETLDAQGTVQARHNRTVFFTSQPARVELVADQSLLVADGVSRPVVMVRITDRHGRRFARVSQAILPSPHHLKAQHKSNNSRSGS